jgi:hypothetical protein
MSKSKNIKPTTIKLTKKINQRNQQGEMNKETINRKINK